MMPRDDDEAPAMLERLGNVAVEMGRAGLRKAVVWAVLGALAGVLADLVTFFVARRVADGDMPLGPAVLSLVTLGIPLLTAAAFAFYGAQVGAIAAGFRHEPEVGVLAYLVRRGLEFTVAELPSGSSVPTRAEVDRAVRAATHRLHGEKRASWTGPFGLVARIVHGTLTSLFERALSSALTEGATTDVRAGVRPETHDRALRSVVASLEELFATVLGLELALLFVGITVSAVAWYPVCTFVVRLVPW